MTTRVLSTYTFDVRINTTIAITAYSEAEAEKQPKISSRTAS